MFKRVKLLFALCLYVTFSFGQTEDSLNINNVLELSLEDLLKIKINVSSVKPVDLLSTPSSVSVVDRKLIEQYDFQSVAEALAIVPGIDVLQTIIDRNVATSRGVLQNFYANKVLLMINNVPTWQPIYGDFHLERIDINDVERIEVLKGPASVLYGTNAYAGVINIILRDKKTSSVDVYGKAGMPSLYGGGLNIKYTKNKFNLYVSANAKFEDRKPYEMKGDSRFLFNGDSTFLFNERYQLGNFILKGSYASHSIMFNGFNFDHSYFGAHPSYISGGGNMVDNHGFLINYQYNDNITQNIHFIGNATYDYFQRHFPLSADRTQLIRLSGTRYSAEGKFDLHLTPIFSFEVGGHGEIRDSHGHETRYALTDSLITPNMLKDDNNYEGSIFVQPELSIGPLSLVVGGRFTKNSLFGSDYSFRASGLYRINRNNSLKVMIGQSFRVPTMFELYFDHYTVKGNRDLQPEKSTSYELAYLVRIENFFLQATGYIASYSNLISRVSVDSNPIPIYMNVDEFEGNGFELELSYRKKEIINMFINYNYIAGYNNSGQHNYMHVPEHTISFGVNKVLRNFYLYCNGQYVSSTYGSEEAISPQFYSDIGVGLHSKLKDLRVKHNLSLKNVTGSEYLIPQYIRDQGGVNELPTMGFGRRLIYTISIQY